LGKVASAAAAFLMGKNSPEFQRNKAPREIVSVTGCSGMLILDSKKTSKSYKNYSGYPGGLKRISLRQMLARKGYGEALRRAIKGMLPKNKLSDVMLKNLKVSE